jgi:ABC-type multidrug transport system fused ATPase/permease subunit
MLALVGLNGAGKTTIAKIPAGLYELDAGRLSVDGRDARELGMPTWRGRLAMVFQDFLRYELSVSDNIAMGRSGPVSDEDVRAAADQAGVSALVEELPMGWDTPLSSARAGEYGSGKATLVKLVCKFYRPTTVTIEVGGESIEDIDTTSWRAAATAAFQDFNRYQVRLRYAIGFGDLPAAADDERVLAAIGHADSQSFHSGLPEEWCSTSRPHRSTHPANTPSSSATPSSLGRPAPGTDRDIGGFAPVLDRADGRPHPRPRRRADHRTRQPPRADGPRRHLCPPVRAAGGGQ